MKEKKLKRYRTSQWERVRRAHLRSSSAFAAELRKQERPRQVAFQRLMAAYDGEPVGIECRADGREAWAFVMRDMSGGKPWRMQCFSADGFSGHYCYSTLGEAVERMIAAGYRTPEPGILDRLAATEDWSIGMTYALILQRRHEGQITDETMHAELVQFALRV